MVELKVEDISTSIKKAARELEHILVEPINEG
jgi:hypothetical protein